MLQAIVKRSVIGLLAGLLLAPTFISSSARAIDDSSESITLSPVSKRYELDAGSATSDSFKILNTGAVGYNFIVYARPYAIINSDYANPNYADAAGNVANADAYKWAQFSQTTYHLNPGESLDVPFTLRVPAGTTPGGHYGVLFAETQSDNSDGSAVTRNKRVGLVIYATVKGSYITGVEVAQPSAQFMQLNPPLTANASIKNTGNTDFLAHVTYAVSDVFGNVKYNDEKDYAVLPGTTRAMSLQWQAAPSFGLFQTEVRIKALDKEVVNKSYVFMAPFWFYGLVAVLLVGGILYAMARRKR